MFALVRFSFLLRRTEAKHDYYGIIIALAYLSVDDFLKQCNNIFIYFFWVNNMVKKTTYICTKNVFVFLHAEFQTSLLPCLKQLFKQK